MRGVCLNESINQHGPEGESLFLFLSPLLQSPLQMIPAGLQVHTFMFKPGGTSEVDQTAYHVWTLTVRLRSICQYIESCISYDYIIFLAFYWSLMADTNILPPRPRFPNGFFVFHILWNRVSTSLALSTPTNRVGFLGELSGVWNHLPQEVKAKFTADANEKRDEKHIANLEQHSYSPGTAQFLEAPARAPRSKKGLCAGVHTSCIED